MSFWQSLARLFARAPAPVSEPPKIPVVAVGEGWPHPWPQLTPADRDVLTRTLFGEAGNETDAGQVAVIHSIRNRLLRGPAKRFGGTPAGVCQKPWQYSCWNANDPMLARMKAMDPNSATYKRLAEVVDRAWQMPDTIGGADHYFANYIAKPRWADPPARMTARHGVHMFFADVP
jgi:N-acetylmuramoyl-L-alanine amidase